MSRKAAKVIGILAGIIAVLAIGASIGVNSLKKDLTALAKAQFKDIDIPALKDGSYHGEYQVAPISVKLDVHIEKGRVAKIDLLEHKNGKGKPGEAVLQKIIDTQRLDVEAVAGASYSSNALKKAVEAALESAR